jgi:maltose alpha-D-glucosyltransferase/alpha-amylase
MAESPPPPAVADAVGPYLRSAATLGTRTGELHLALAANARDPAFAPEPITAADLDALRGAIREQAEKALTTLRAAVGRLTGEVASGARQFLDAGPGLLDDPPAVPGPGANGQKIRCHGDYHLGQVLWADDDFIILDFEGEPTRTVEERRARQSPLKDVAGMLRSFDYAAHAGLFAVARDRPGDFARLQPWADLWRDGVSAAFLRAYRGAAGGAAFLPAEPARFAALLDAFVLDKAFYELVYELNNRPDWVRIPLRGILGLLGQAEGAAGSRATKGPIP